MFGDARVSDWEARKKQANNLAGRTVLFYLPRTALQASWRSGSQSADT